MTRRVVAWKLFVKLSGGRFIRGLQRDPTLLLDELIDLKEPHIYLQQLYFRRSGLTLIVSRLRFWTLVMGSWPWCHPALLSEAPNGPGLRVGSSAPLLNCSVWAIILVKDPVALIAFVFVPNNVWYESIAEKILGSGRTIRENVKYWSIFYYRVSYFWSVQTCSCGNVSEVHRIFIRSRLSSRMVSGLVLKCCNVGKMMDRAPAPALPQHSRLSNIHRKLKRLLQICIMWT